MLKKLCDRLLELSFLPEKISTFIHETNQALVLPETGSSDVVPVASSLNVIPETGLPEEHKKKKKTRRRKKKKSEPEPVQETHARILIQLQKGPSHSVDDIQTPQCVVTDNKTLLSELSSEVHEASPFSFNIDQEKSWADVAEEEEKKELIKKKTY